MSDNQAPQIKTSKTELIATSNFLVKFLRDAGYKGSLEDGTALHDAVIKPMALLYTVLKHENNRASAYFSLARAAELKEMLGAEYGKIVDSLMDNWFVKRHQGSATQVIVSMVFSRALDYLRIRKDDIVCSIDGVMFRAMYDKIYIESDFSMAFNTQDNVHEYSIPMYLVADGPGEMELNETSEVASFISNIYFQKATVAGLLSLGVDIESDDAFLARTSTAITTRELITERAIRVRVLQEFANVFELYVAKYGSVEQQRDLKVFEDIIVHVGNKADIYLKYMPIMRALQVELDAENKFALAQIPEDVLEVTAVRDAALLTGVIRLEFSEIPARDVNITTGHRFLVGERYFAPTRQHVLSEQSFLLTTEGSTFYVALNVVALDPGDAAVDADDDVIPEQTYPHFVKGTVESGFRGKIVTHKILDVHEFYAGSLDTNGTIHVTGAMSSPVAQIDYITSPVVRAVHDYINSAENRVVNYSPLVKTMFPIVVTADLVVQVIPEPTLTEAELRERIKKMAAEYVNNIAWRKTFQVSELIHYLHTHVPDIGFVQLPGIFTAYVREPATKEVIITQIANRYIMPKDVSRQLTWNTVMFYSDPSLVQVRFYS